MGQTDTYPGIELGARYEFEIHGFGKWCGTVVSVVRNAHGDPVQINLLAQGGELSIAWHCVIAFRPVP